jgi:hypothetical protein
MEVLMDFMDSRSLLKLGGICRLKMLFFPQDYKTEPFILKTFK